MRLIVISGTGRSSQEIQHVIRLFNEGLETFHLRKPAYSRQQIKDYIENLPEKYHKCIVLHSHYSLALKYNVKGIHLGRKFRKKKFRIWWKLKKLRVRRPDLLVSTSFHSLLSLLEARRDYDYVFISPVFNSISKKGYGAAFSYNTLRATLKKTRYDVIALGGIDAGRVNEVRDLGFSGFALLGAVWSGDRDPVEVFKSVRNAVNGQSGLVKELEINPVKISL